MEVVIYLSGGHSTQQSNAAVEWCFMREPQENFGRRDSMSSITASANMLLPVNVKKARPSWVLYGSVVMTLVFGPSAVAAGFLLLQMH